MSMRDEYIETIKTAALNLGKRLVLEYLVKEFPLLGSRLLNPIVGYFVGVVLEIAIKKTELGVFFLFIDMRTSAQGRAFERSALANRQAQLTGTEEEKRHAEEALIRDFRAFAKFNS